MALRYRKVGIYHGGSAPHLVLFSLTFPLVWGFAFEKEERRKIIIHTLTGRGGNPAIVFLLFFIFIRLVFFFSPFWLKKGRGKKNKKKKKVEVLYCILSPPPNRYAPRSLDSAHPLCPTATTSQPASQPASGAFGKPPFCTGSTRGAAPCEEELDIHRQLPTRTRIWLRRKTTHVPSPFCRCTSFRGWEEVRQLATLPDPCWGILVSDGVSADLNARFCTPFPISGQPECCLPCPKQNFFYPDRMSLLLFRFLVFLCWPRLDDPAPDRIPKDDLLDRVHQPRQRRLLLPPPGQLRRASDRGYAPPLSERLLDRGDPVAAGTRPLHWRPLPCTCTVRIPLTPVDSCPSWCHWETKCTNATTRSRRTTCTRASTVPFRAHWCWAEDGAR